jgi:hypothetical protein
MAFDAKLEPKLHEFSSAQAMIGSKYVKKRENGFTGKLGKSVFTVYVL